MAQLREIIAYLADADAETIAKHTPNALATSEALLAETRKLLADYRGEVDNLHKTLAWTRDRHAETIAKLEAVPLPNTAENGNNYLFCPGIGYVAQRIGSVGDLVKLGALGHIARAMNVPLTGTYEYSANKVVARSAGHAVTVIFTSGDRKYIETIITEFTSDKYLHITRVYNTDSSLKQRSKHYSNGDVRVEQYVNDKVTSKSRQVGNVTTITECGDRVTIETKMHPNITRVQCGNSIKYRLKTDSGPVTYTFGVDGAIRDGVPVAGGLKIMGRIYRFTHDAICEVYKIDNDTFEYRFSCDAA